MEPEIKEIEELNTKAWANRSAKLRNSYEIALNCKKKSIEIDYKKGIADSHKILGYCFWRFSDFTESLSHSLVAIELFKELKDKKGEADTMNNIGAVYMFQKEHEKRLECNLKCLELREQINDVDGVSSSQNNIGETYMEMGNLPKAIEWFQKCLQNPHSSVQTKSWAWFNLGKVEQQQNRWEESEKYFLLSLENSLSVNYEVLATDVYLSLGSFYQKKKEFAKAEEFLMNGLILAKRIGAREEIKNAYFILSNLKDEEGNTAEALEFFKKYHIAHVEIFNESNLQKIRDIEFQYEIDKISKEAEIERLKTVELKKANERIEKQSQIMHERNREITDSILYAAKIQQAILQEEEYVSKHLPEHFVLFKPKDIVSGDFYWMNEIGDDLFVSVADCTGHGVPGAFLTLLGTTFLNEITRQNHEIQPAEILEELRKRFIYELSPDGESRDGMDISLIKINLKTNEAVWAGANNPVWIINKNGEEKIIEADKQSIGYAELLEPFTNHPIQLNKADMIYLFSDGYADQFGGRLGKKFRKSNLLNLIKSIHHLEMNEQKEKLNSNFEEWKGKLDQIDDVCLIGMRI